MMNDTYPVSMDIIQGREVSKRLDAREKEVGAPANGRKRGEPGNLSANRSLWNLEFECSVLSADDWVALITEFVKIPIVHPNVLRKLELPAQARANRLCPHRRL